MVMCGTNTGYHQGGKESFIYRTLTCTSSCTWPENTPCNACVENPYCGQHLANGMTGACYCMNEQPVSNDKDCPLASKPIDSQTCERCGTQTRTVSCDTSTGDWKTGVWSKCDTSACATQYDCCCGNGIEISNRVGVSCSSYNYTPKLIGCVCGRETCNANEAALCTDCGGTWNDTKCTCDCGFFKGNSCKFTSGGCLCGDIYRACR